MGNEAKVTQQAKYQKMLTAVKGMFGGKKTLTIGGEELTLEGVLGLVRNGIQLAKATEDQGTLYHSAVAAERKNTAELKPLCTAIRKYLVGIYGASSQELLKFGFKPTTPRKPSAKTKAQAVDKSKATREARGTKGKRQKESIQGTVASTVPSASPPAGSTPPAAAVVTTTTTQTNGSANGSAH